MSVVSDKPTHAFRCTGCGTVTEIPRRVITNSEAFRALLEHMTRQHPAWCRGVVVDSMVRRGIISLPWPSTHVARSVRTTDSHASFLKVTSPATSMAEVLDGRPGASVYQWTRYARKRNGSKPPDLRRARLQPCQAIEGELLLNRAARRLARRPRLLYNKQ